MSKSLLLYLTGANLFDGKGNADDILPLREMEISLTPEFHLPCPSTKSDINLNSLHTFIPCGPSVTSSTQNDLNVSTTATCTSLSGKSKNSRIPRFQDLPVSVKKKTCLFMNANKTKPNYSGNILKSSADNAKLNSGSCPKKTFTQSAKFCTRSTNYDFSNKHSDQETNLTVINPNGIEAEDCHHRKTFVVPKSKNVADIEKPQNNRRKTFIKKSCATDQKNVSYGDKRKTFVVSKSNVKFIDDNKNCNTSFDESLSDSITLCNQNLTHSFDCNTKISSDLPIAPVLNTAVSVCSTEESNKNMQSTESLSEEIQNPAANQFQESQLGNEKMVNIPVINYIETPSVSSDKEFENFIHTVEKLNEQSIQNSSQELLTNHQNAVQNDINAVQNNFQKLNTSKYKNRENLFDSKGLNLQECGTNRNESVAKEKEYSQNSSELSQTPKLNKSHLPRKEQAKWYNFKFSSDSEGEMCNMDLNFDKPITLVKDPPTSESNVFHLDKNKPSLSTNKPHELEPAENTLKVQDEGDILTQSNSHTSSNIEMQNIQDTADIGIEICKKMKHYAEFNEENHEDKNHVSATKNKIYRKNSAQDIQDIMKIKKQPIKKKRLSVRFSEDSNVNENCASNIKSKACRNKTNKHAKLQKLAASKNLKTVDISEKAKNLTELDRKTNVPSFFPKEDSHCQTDTLSNDTNTHIYNQTEDAKGNKENLPVDEIKSKVSSLCPATDTSASCKSNVVSNDENISVCNETECLTDFDNFKSTRIAVVELNRSDVEIDVPKKSKRKRKFPDDPVPSDDCLSLKRTKVTNSKEVDKCINPPEITSDKAKKGENFEKKCAENETVNKKTNRRKKVQSNNENIYLPDNIIHVQAEVHPPPSFVNMSPISFPSVKNTKIDEKEQTKRLSVVLSDVLQSKDIIHLNIISNEEKTHISSKIPSSENHSDQTTTVVKNEAETDQNSNCVNGLYFSFHYVFMKYLYTLKNGPISHQ